MTGKGLQCTRKATLKEKRVRLKAICDAVTEAGRRHLASYSGEKWGQRPRWKASDSNEEDAQGTQPTGRKYFALSPRQVSASATTSCALLAMAQGGAGPWQGWKWGRKKGSQAELEGLGRFRVRDWDHWAGCGLCEASPCPGTT